MSVPIVSVKNVSHSYRPGVPVLNNISFDVFAGEVVGLIGLSGAGKSTLLRCINGLVQPTSGSCRTFGVNIGATNGKGLRKVRRRIGMIFQEFNLVERSSVLTNVLIGRLGYTGFVRSALRLFKHSDTVLVNKSISEVGLHGFQYRRARSLSGGQKQRVAIARAMAQEAELILADEATANLDILTKDGIMDLLCRWPSARRGTVLLSMHDLPLAKRYCTRIIGISQGQVVFDAVPSSLTDAAIAQILGTSFGESDDLTHSTSTKEHSS